jgi:hypothetical protein
MLRKSWKAAARLGAGAICAAAMGGGIVATAAPAGAAGAATPQLGSCNVMVVWTVSATSITGNIHTLCPLQSPSLFPDAVTIFKLEGAAFVGVASGTGSATYTCHGSTENEFVIGGHEFEAACS